MTTAFVSPFVSNHKVRNYQSALAQRQQVFRVQKQYSRSCSKPICCANIVKSTSAEEIIRNFWNGIDQGTFSETLSLFSDDAVYYDMLYSKPFVGKKEIEKHLKNMEQAFPKQLCFILDDLAAGSEKVGARWHVEFQNGQTLPFSRGASMYSFVSTDNGLLIQEAWDFPETPLKAAPIVFPLIRLATKVLGNSRQ